MPRLNSRKLLLNWLDLVSLLSKFGGSVDLTKSFLFLPIRTLQKTDGGVCMLRVRTVRSIGAALVVGLLLPSGSLRAHTASTSTVTGTVSDKSVSTIPNAKV